MNGRHRWSAYPTWSMDHAWDSRPVEVDLELLEKTTGSPGRLQPWDEADPPGCGSASVMGCLLWFDWALTVRSSTDAGRGAGVDDGGVGRSWSLRCVMWPGDLYLRRTRSATSCSAFVRGAPVVLRLQVPLTTLPAERHAPT
jgi:hypothetical protein